jgi:purine-nucleoside phosphorylase
MPTPHNEAKPGDIAECVLLPGDPLRAKFIAEHYLDNAVQYNSVRNMFGYTGTYKGKRVSVQGTGMGIPSISIYVNELFDVYGVKRAIRIGTAGSLQEDVPLYSIVLAEAACTDSGVNGRRFGGRSFAPCADWPLLKKAWDVTQERGWPTRVGSVVSDDLFYTDSDEDWKIWRRYGCLAVEMETAELYTLAAKFGRQALSILTISDSMVTHQAASSEERQNSFTNMMETALETIIS